MKNRKTSNNIRIIPRLDVKGPNLVKGIHLEGLRVLGKPEDFALQYYRDGADELLYMDIVASLYGRNNLLQIVEKTSQNTFIPLAAGGGVRTLGDIRALLRAGAEKVVVNTAAISNPDFIAKAAKTFGSQCIVLSIEAKKQLNGSYEAYTNNGRERTGIDVFQWAKRAAELGAGEILITSIDKEGTGEGYDIELVKKITDSVSIPVIACGGAGKKEHIAEIIKGGGADAASAASIFHYNYLENISPDSFRYQEEGNIDFLKRKSQIKEYLEGRIAPASIIKVKSFLADMDIACRKSFEVQRSASDAKKNYPSVAIIDYGLGNLFSTRKALEYAGANVAITDDPKMIESVDGLILPGVGAFGDGMKGLKERGFIGPIKSAVAKGKLLFGICLGMQLLMAEGEEFGHHQGLDLIKGKVIRLKESKINDSYYKIPHIKWNGVYSPKLNYKKTKISDIWKGTVLDNIEEGTPFYFIHSYVVVPENHSNILALTDYGDSTFCSVISKDNIFGCQFHPEKSGQAGLKYYENMIGLIKNIKNRR